MNNQFYIKDLYLLLLKGEINIIGTNVLIRVFAYGLNGDPKVQTVLLKSKN
jgi:hypothetical protein